jgi:hypothetical protein
MPNYGLPVCCYYIRLNSQEGIGMGDGVLFVSEKYVFLVFISFWKEMIYDVASRGFALLIWTISTGCD